MNSFAATSPATGPAMATNRLFLISWRAVSVAMRVLSLAMASSTMRNAATNLAMCNDRPLAWQHVLFW